MVQYVLASGLQVSDWLNLVGLILGIFPIIGVGFTLVRRILQTSPRIALHEFTLLVRRPGHIVLMLIVFGATGYLIARPPSRFPISLVLLIPTAAIVMLLISFFLAQSRRLSDAVILNEMTRMSKAVRAKPGGVLAAIRFDIDRLKAISNRYPAVAEQIRAVVDEAIRDEVAKRRKAGVDVVAHAIAGEDETVVIAAGLSIDQAADFADKVRRAVKDDIKSIPYYNEATKIIVDGMQHSPSNMAEEREGIGTVSAGVAADYGRPDMLFSDISAAVKDAKTRGRNKTVIYRPGQAPEIRSDFQSGSP